MLKDNYRSVLAAQRMKEAIERMDSAALFIVAGDGKRHRTGGKESRHLRSRVESPGSEHHGGGRKGIHRETPLCVEELSSEVCPSQKTTSTEEAKRLYFSELENAFLQVKTAADEILAINQDAMVRKSDAVRRTAERMKNITIIVALAALALGLFLSLLSDPAHIAAARFVERSDPRNLAKVISIPALMCTAVTSWRSLAHDFNAMAARLAEYRKSSFGELLQAHLSMQSAIDSLPTRW